MKVVNRKWLANVALMMAMFLNPLGYDALFYGVLQATGGSYVLTTSIFYLLSALSFGVYLFSPNKNKWFLAAGMFFNPLGYDVLFYMVYGLLGSYMLANLMFYIGALTFLGVFLWLAKVNPMVYLNNWVTIIRGKLRK